MPYRIEKLNSLIKEEISKILLRELEFPKNAIVSVTYVKTSADARFATAGISVLPENKEAFVLKKLQNQIAEIQKMLNRKLIMRYVPKISFKIDKTAARIDRFEKIARELK